jgi:hypothetical protein
MPARTLILRVALPPCGGLGGIRDMRGTDWLHLSICPDEADSSSLSHISLKLASGTPAGKNPPSPGWWMPNRISSSVWSGGAHRGEAEVSESASIRFGQSIACSAGSECMQGRGEFLCVCLHLVLPWPLR